MPLSLQTLTRSDNECAHHVHTCALCEGGGMGTPVPQSELLACLVLLYLNMATTYCRTQVRGLGKDHNMSPNVLP